MNNYQAERLAQESIKTMKTKKKTMEAKKTVRAGSGCSRCKGVIGAVICPCEMRPRHDADYEAWLNK